MLLFRGPDAWYARFDDPAIHDLFGTDTVPTAFTAEADAETVLRIIQRLHPHHTVTLAEPNGWQQRADRRPPASPPDLQ